MRQREDQAFAQLLMKVRMANCSEDDIELLKSRVVSKSDVSYPTESLHVFKTNKDADEHNSNHLKNLQLEYFISRPLIRKRMSTKDGLIDVVISTKPSDTGRLCEIVSVAVGAR